MWQGARLDDLRYFTSYSMILPLQLCICHELFHSCWWDNSEMLTSCGRLSMVRVFTSTVCSNQKDEKVWVFSTPFSAFWVIYHLFSSISCSTCILEYEEMNVSYWVCKKVSLPIPWKILSAF